MAMPTGSYVTEFLMAGIAAAIPAFGMQGRYYWATDTLILYRDTGAAWVEIARGETAIRLAQLAERAHASLTGVGINDHHDEVHGAAKHTNVTRELFVSAGEAVVLAGALVGLYYGLAAEGGANVNEPKIQLYFKVPDDFVSFTSLKLVWTSPAAAGNMRWKMGAQYGASGEDYKVHIENTTWQMTATGGAVTA